MGHLCPGQEAQMAPRNSWLTAGNKFERGAGSGIFIIGAEQEDGMGRLPMSLCICPIAERPAQGRPPYRLCNRHQPPPVRWKDRRTWLSGVLAASTRPALDCSDAKFGVLELWDPA